MKRTIAALILLTVFAQQPAMAQALPVANFAINRAIAGIITRVAASRGFAANDARTIATLTAISANSTALNVVSTGATIGLSLAGAPVWLTILAGLGVVGAGTQLLAQFGDAEVSIGQTSDGFIEVGSKIPRKKPVTLPPYPTLETRPTEEPLFETLRSLGARVYRVGPCSPERTRIACHEFPPLPPVDTGIALDYSEYGIRIPFDSIAELEDLRARWLFAPGEPDPQLRIIETFSDDGEFAGFAERMWTNKHRFCNKDTPPLCPAEYEWATLKVDPAVFDITRDAFHGLNRVTTQAVYPDLDAARVAMDRDLMSMPMSPSTLAAIVDESWRQAAEAPEYAGLPYREWEPVTEDDVEIWVTKNPKDMPRIGDIIEPANQPGETMVPISPRIRPRQDPSPHIAPEIDPRTQPEIDPATDPDPNSDPETKTEPQGERDRRTGAVQDVNVVNRPIVDIGNRVKVDIDLGNASEVDRPELKDTPTAKMIIDPISSLTSDFGSWTMPSHGSTCPRTTLHVFDQAIPISAHCEIAESIKPQLRPAMVAAFAILAFLLVLSA